MARSSELSSEATFLFSHSSLAARSSELCLEATWARSLELRLRLA